MYRTVNPTIRDVNRFPDHQLTTHAIKESVLMLLSGQERGSLRPLQTTSLCRKSEILF